ncbi:twin-arginine translocase subunit TatC [Pelagibacterales bacterium]|jgi:sec-independent protein translocase protein TatC|nr:twin-arginine translocase subunit TatC [Pelagibacterales bacterium]MDB9818706.1 twin-arginine translocase subunit TatC [Pelagibacterales bacterium]|tara:strand:+ start:547 stop:1317 length:771 start_codon:yes stop_codon:yes gene_type:complete
MSLDKNVLSENKQPLLVHLVELRSRLIKTMIMITILFVIFYFFADSIYNFLVQPYADAVEGEEGRRLIFTALHETFFTYIKVALFASLFISLPFLLIQLWIFVAPGLYKNEKSVVVPYLLATPILFILGSALVYYLIMPLAIKFFLSFESIGGNGALPIQLEAKVNEYLSLIMRLILAFGLCFQLPVALTLLARVGFVSSESLRKNRKYVIVGVFAVAAILTPPDPISQIGLGIPILLLYELSIIAVSFIEKRKNN